MSKYINADELTEYLADDCFTWRWLNDDRADEVDSVIKAIAEMPAADVVEVVRCKDCKYYTDYMAYTKSFKSHYCSGGFVDSNMALHPDDFCSYGERKGKEQNERK